MAPKPVDVPQFASAQLALLARELQSEIAETADLVAAHSPQALQRSGLALTNLVLSGRRTGMGGRTVVELSADPATTTTTTSSSPGSSGGGQLPEHGLRTGDIVLVAAQPAGAAKRREMKEMERRGVKGVVVRTRRADVSVALDGGGGGGADGKGGADGGDEDAVLGGRVWMVKLADDVTYRR